MKYLKKFETHAGYEAYKNSQDYLTPNVSYCVDLNEVHFEKYVRDYSKEYFTIEALEDGNVYFKYQEWSPIETQRYMEYSKDGGETWVRTTNVANEEVVMTIPMTAGETALVRGDNDTFASYDESEDAYYNPFFYSDMEFSVYGNIMSLIHGDDFIGETTVTDYMFFSLFYDLYGDDLGGTPLECLIINAENLILPATTLADGCYERMFNGCTSLATAPELPATTLTIGCYSTMFYNCTSLTTAPELPATTLSESCYGSMFDGCASLTTAPELPATTLSESCYNSMFNGCASLTTAPELPATTLASYCYNGMFDGCASLTTAPELPATTLAERCYGGMFSGCTSLATAPELPATTLASGCYGSMFAGCINMNYIKAMFTTTPSTSYTKGWVNNVSSSGTFVKNSAATWNVTGNNGVPSGWTVQTAN